MSQAAVLAPADTAAQIEQACADFLAACLADPAREESASPVQHAPVATGYLKLAAGRAVLRNFARLRLVMKAARVARP